MDGVNLHSVTHSAFQNLQNLQHSYSHKYIFIIFLSWLPRLKKWTECHVNNSCCAAAEWHRIKEKVGCYNLFYYTFFGLVQSRWKWFPAVASHFTCKREIMSLELVIFFPLLFFYPCFYFVYLKKHQRG